MEKPIHILILLAHTAEKNSNFRGIFKVYDKGVILKFYFNITPFDIII